MCRGKASRQAGGSDSYHATLQIADSVLVRGSAVQLQEVLSAPSCSGCPWICSQLGVKNQPGGGQEEGKICACAEALI